MNPDRQPSASIVTGRRAAAVVSLLHRGRSPATRPPHTDNQPHERNRLKAAASRLPQAERSVDRRLREPFDPEELVARAVAADKRHRRSADAEPVSDQAADGIVRAAVNGWGLDAHDQDPLAHADELVLARPRLHANGDGGGQTGLHGTSMIAPAILKA
jgi:DNA-binding response OmpR family regulator